MEVTLLGITMSLAMVWVIIAVVLALIEAATTSLTTLWFVGGALAAMVAALLGAGVPVQVGLFLGFSIILLIFTRPIVKKRMKVGKERTNVNALIGKTGTVTKEIPAGGAGEVRLNGLTWTALGEDEERKISLGSRVTVLRVEGVKLIVR